MVSGGFLEKWIGVCRRRRRTTTNQSYSHLEQEEAPESETGIEEDEPRSRIRTSTNNKFQKFHQSKAQLMKLGSTCLQYCANRSRRARDDDVESGTRIKEDETRRRSLPEEIVVEILTRVPFKTLLRCRCVCKSWHSFISQPCFTKIQLLRNHNTTYYDEHDDEIGDYVMFSNKRFSSSDIHFHSMCGHTYVTKKLQLPIKPSFGFRHFVPSGAEKVRPYCPLSIRTSLFDLAVVGACNGLLCIMSYRVAFLWNPALNKMRVIQENELMDFHVVGGLCFMPQTMDFKVVKIWHDYGSKPPDVRIYSTSTNSWKISAHNESRCWRIAQQGPSPFVEGALHWCVDMYPRRVILCFDVSQEAFREIGVPVDREIAQIAKVTEFRGRIACFLDDPIDHTWLVWVMNEYGVADSWTQLYTFGYAHGIPRVIMNDGEVMVTSSNGDFFLFDPTTQNYTKKVEVMPGCHDMVAYKGSLALLNEGKQSRICLFCGFMNLVLLLQSISMMLVLLEFCLSD